jgi:tellurite resistance-related uncharacterized protein
LRLVPYKQTATFHADTLPDALRREHRTKAGVWGRIVVVSGRLRFTDARGVVDLTGGEVVEVEPESPHAVEAVGEVAFYVEFCREADEAES